MALPNGHVDAISSGPRIEFDNILCREREVFGKGSVTVYTYTDGVFTNVKFPAAAVATVSAGDMSFAGDPVANLQVLHPATHIHNLAHIFVADGHGGLDRFL